MARNHGLGIGVVLLACTLVTTARAQESCPRGEKRLHPGDECIPGPLFNYLYCLERSGSGRIEISRQGGSGRDASLQITLKGSGSGVIVKGEGGSSYSTTDSQRAIDSLHERLDPTLAAKCERVVTPGPVLHSQQARPSGAPASGSPRPPIEVRNPPRSPGMLPPVAVADFRGTKGSGARTVNGLAFSLMSDSSFNMKSKVWYERVQESNEAGTGFMRIFYEIVPTGDAEGYVGVYADFTPPPPKSVSMEGRQGVALRMRLAQEADSLPEVRFVLYSDNNINPLYAYPIARVQVNRDWRKFTLPFSDFGPPPFARSQIQLDTRRLFRFGIVVVSDKAVHGYLDVTDIVFF
jgi:hypothetical protein